MAPYAADSPSLCSPRPGSQQNATSSTPSRKLAQLVSKFETLDLMGSRGVSSKQKSTLRRPPLLLPGSKTMSSLFKSNPQAASSVASGLDSLSSSPSKMRISTSGSVQRLPFVTLYPPGARKTEGERPRAKSTVAETRKMFESVSVFKNKRDWTPIKAIKDPLRSQEKSEIVLYSHKQPLKPSLPSYLNHISQQPSRNPPTSGGINPIKTTEGPQSTVDQERPFKISSCHDSSSKPLYLTDESPSTLVSAGRVPYRSAHDIPPTTQVFRTHHRGHVDYASIKVGHPRVMAATDDTGSSISHMYERIPSHSPAETPSRNGTSLVTSLEPPSMPDPTPLASRQSVYSAALENEPCVSSSASPSIMSIAGCSTPGEEITFYHRDAPTDNPRAIWRLEPPTKKWTPQRIVTPQKATVANMDHITESRHGQGTFVRDHAPPSLRETIGLFESMSYRSSISAARHTTAREPTKPPPGEIKVQKRSIRGNAHEKIKGSLRNLSSTWGRKTSKPQKNLDSFTKYPGLWKVDSIKARTGTSFHTQYCELSQPDYNPYENSDKPIYELYSNTRKMWDSWARDKANGRGLYDDNVGYRYTSLHASVLDPEKDQPVYVEETSSVYSTDVNPAVQEAIEAARRRSRRWISRSSGTLVSQAHCKLEQPKPVHANEVKRLISLCKTRVAEHKRRGNTE